MEKTPKYVISPSEEGVTPEEALADFQNDYAKISNIYKEVHNFPKDIQSQLKVKFLSELDTVLKKEAADAGIEIDGKTTTKELLESVLSFGKSQIEAKEAEIAAAKKGGESVEEVEKLKNELTAIKELNKELKVKFKEKDQEIEKVKSEYTAKERAAIVRTKLSEAKSRVRIVDDKVLRKAVDYDLAEYEFDIDEDGKDIVKKGGQIIKSSVNSGEFASHEEIIRSVAEQNNALVKTTALGQHNPNAYSGTPPPNKAAF